MLNEINDVKPTSIRHIVGQVGVVTQVGVALDAAFADGRKFDSAFLSALRAWESRPWPRSLPRKWRLSSTKFSDSRSPVSAT